MIIESAEFTVSSPSLAACPKTDLPEFAFTGRSNVGKSSLINMLAGRKGLAKISSTPGKTRLINHFLFNENWYLVDLPGYGYAKTSKDNRKMFSGLITDYIAGRRSMVCLFLLIDIRHKPLKNDVAFINWLGSNAVPFTIVFTKADKLYSSQLKSNLNHYQKELLQTWESLPTHFVSSSVTQSGKEEILTFIGSTLKSLKV